MSRFSFHLMTNGILPLPEVIHKLKDFPFNGIDVLHLREKQRPARELLEWSQALKSACIESSPGIRLFINDRVDVALSIEASGIHLAYHSLPLIETRKLVGNRLLIGCSVHSVQEAIEAEANGANYAFFGHVYESASKPGLSARGITALQAVVDTVNIPIIAIGGIDEKNIAEVTATGCSGIAVISTVWGDSDPAGKVKRIREELDRSPFYPRVPFPCTE